MIAVNRNSKKWRRW